MNLTDKITVVTGAASGIGLATAKAFAAVGGTVYLGDLNEADGEQAAADIRSTGGAATFIPLDIANDDAITAFKNQIISESGRLDVLANVAGWGHTEFFVESSPASWDKEIDINLKGAAWPNRFTLAPRAVRSLLPRPSLVKGRAITLPSIAFARVPLKHLSWQIRQRTFRLHLKKPSRCAALVNRKKLPMPSCFSLVSGRATALARCLAFRVA
jgi:NAD(P)-dependent dehydrogenase (short-subunit alcohol dehydrogenase family)